MPEAIIKNSSTVLAALIFVLFSCTSHAIDYYYIVDGKWEPKYSSAEEACKVKHQQYFSQDYASKFIPLYRTAYLFPPNSTSYICELYYLNGPRYDRKVGGYTRITRHGNSCPNDKTFNPYTGECESPDDGVTRKKIGSAQPLTCSEPRAMQGNPVNISTGNKYQLEFDIEPTNEIGSLALKRHYNSQQPYWRHNFSYKLIINNSSFFIQLEDGSSALYTRTPGNPKSILPGHGIIQPHPNGWEYLSSKEALVFNSSGDLIQATAFGKLLYNVSRPREKELLISGPAGEGALHLIENSDGQLAKATYLGKTVSYSYNGIGNLIKASYTDSSSSRERLYHYEDNNDKTLLTGITDERGVRYATWTYDDQGRAISSEHANGADRVSVSYNSDGTVSVTNELGKVAKYSFQTIRGVRRITSIDGEPSPNCPNSNSTFTYDERGLLKTKTDNKGIFTTYAYDERGLEVSRTEASGTPQARTITTTWHADWFLPVTITEPDHITQYTYDSQGRQTSQSITQR